MGGFFINPLFRKVGAVLPGFVRNMQPYGCFVDFPHQLTGLAHLKHLSDQFVSRPSEVYQETQTVWTKVRGKEAGLDTVRVIDRTLSGHLSLIITTMLCVQEGTSYQLLLCPF